jgi:hypothetical protein
MRPQGWGGGVMRQGLCRPFINVIFLELVNLAKASLSIRRVDVMMVIYLTIYWLWSSEQNAGSPTAMILALLHQWSRPGIANPWNWMLKTDRRRLMADCWQLKAHRCRLMSDCWQLKTDCRRLMADGRKLEAHWLQKFRMAGCCDQWEFSFFLVLSIWICFYKKGNLISKILGGKIGREKGFIHGQKKIKSI